MTISRPNFSLIVVINLSNRFQMDETSKVTPRATNNSGHGCIDEPLWRRVPLSILQMAFTRTSSGHPQVLVKWNSGKQHWSNIRHVTVRDDGSGFWKKEERIQAHRLDRGTTTRQATSTVV